ncbi:MAG TPA: glutamate racemase [Candidatus Aquicultor sp.]
MDNRPIGVFDSGLGGLTVVKEIMRQLPNEEIVYFGDTARFPYGPRSTIELRGFVFEIIDFLLSQNVKFVVVACNSASAAALDAAQQYYDIPVIGVIEPGARAAVHATHSRRVGVIGTQATISSGSYVAAIKSMDAGVHVHPVACPDLADFVERDETSGEVVETAIRRYLGPLVKAGIDSLILGCTHYPLLAETIASVAGENIKLISSAQETARELQEYLTRKDSLRETATSPCPRFYSSGDEDIFKQLGARFLGQAITAVEQVRLPVREGVSSVEAK